MFKKTVFLISMLVAVYGCGSSSENNDQDTTAPTVTSTSPENNATCVAVDSNVIASFSEAMSSSSISETTFYVREGESSISGSVVYYGTFATFDPMTSLSSFRGYTATVTTGVKDSNGNPLASSYSWGFVTGSSSTSTVSFASGVQRIFTNDCIVCHISSASGQSSSLPLTDDVSYGNLVSKASTYTAGSKLVVPCDSSNSILYKRISGTTVGLQMPRGGSALSSSDQNLIKTWIDEGALNN